MTPHQVELLEGGRGVKKYAIGVKDLLLDCGFPLALRYEAGRVVLTRSKR